MLIRLLSGCALLALAAPALSQTSGSNSSTVTNPETNEVRVENDAPGNERNVSQISFVGSGNRHEVEQVGDDNTWQAQVTGDGNVSSARQYGNNNDGTLLQHGYRNSSLVDQYLDPRIDVVGDRTAIVEQRGTGNSSAIEQVHWNNYAKVVQGTEEAASTSAVSTVRQYSAFNSATVTMLGGTVEAPNRSHIEQTRTDPLVTRSSADVFIRGAGNLSFLYQMGAGFSGTHSQTGDQNTITSRSFGENSQNNILQTGYRNFASVGQFASLRNSSIIEQHIDPAIEITGDRTAVVLQYGADNTSSVIQRLSGNVANVTQASGGNSSTLLQQSRNNNAQVWMWGGTPTALNKSTITQGPIENQDTRLVANVVIDGYANESVVDQLGSRHSAFVSLRGGSPDPYAVSSDLSRVLVNRSFVRQRGSIEGHFARVSMVDLIAGPNGDNSVGLEQFGDTTSPHNADIWVFGRFTEINLTQRSRHSGSAVASIASLAEEGSVQVRQVGQNNARITQGSGTFLTLNLTQYDNGGGVRAGVGESYGDGASRRGNNSFHVSQNGSANSVLGWQEGSDLIGLIWQKAGSNNYARINQGSRTFVPYTRQFAFRSLAEIIQQGSYNSTNIDQYSIDATARVEQAGLGTAGLSNQARVEQVASGQALIVQSVGVGPSATGDPASGLADDPKYFAGGARATEAIIYQNVINGSAKIQQHGRGQLAEIRQSGTDNVASILQEVGATNATAIIVQSGSGNYYVIQQSQPGQYIHVAQTGSGNVVNKIQRGPGS